MLGAHRVSTDPDPREEVTLDPADWADFRRLAHRMVEDMVDHLATLRSRPVWQPMPNEVRDSFDQPVPMKGQGAEAAYRAFATNVMPYPNGNLHPGYFGWVQGTGTPLSMMADMLAAGLNPHMGGHDQAPVLVEKQVISWLVQLMGLPAGASGLLVLGGSMANILGLAVARSSQAGFDLRQDGLWGAKARMMIYASSETHGWIGKAIELLGFGHASLRHVPVGPDYRMSVRALKEQIQADRASGLQPICVVGNAGTVNTGATDDLRQLARVCRDEGLWFHVDGAFGALARLSERLRETVNGIEEADSLAFDLHKWMYQPFDVGCLLVRDGDAHRAAFARSTSYLRSMARGVMAGGLPFADLGVDLTRGFRALKVWMSLKAHGVETFGRLIEQNVDQAQYLARRVAAHPQLQLLAPAPLNVVCFRFAPGRMEEAALNRLNEELLFRLQESGVAVPSSTALAGRFALRCAIVNHRSVRADLDRLVEAAVAIGRQLVHESHGSRAREAG